MKVLVTILAFMALAAGKSIPTASQSHVIALPSGGSSLLSLVVNVNKAVENLVDIQEHPVAATPVAVNDGFGVEPSPVVVAPGPVAPETPAPIVLPEPARPEIVAWEPEIPSVVLPVPAVPEVIVPELEVPAPIVHPEPALPEIVVLEPIILPEIVVPEAALEPEGSLSGVSKVTNNFFLKIFNFIMGDGSSPDFSTLPQGLGATIVNN